MGFMDNLSAFTKGVGAKAKGNYDVVSMNAHISSLKKDIKEEYRKIGKQYYEQNKDNVDDEYKDSMKTISSKLEKIEEIKKQIEETKEATAAVSFTPADDDKDDEAVVAEADDDDEDNDTV